jgi:SHS2 domain-containing protein
MRRARHPREAAGRDPTGQRGHGSLPHTADLRLHAWAATREDCVAEAVLALVESFADTAGATVTRTVVTDIADEGDVAVLLRALDEVIFLVDADGMVPLTVSTERPPSGSLRLVLGVTDLAHVRFCGPAPKAVTRSALRFEETPSGWSCDVTVDV